LLLERLVDSSILPNWPPFLKLLQQVRQTRGGFAGHTL
jgi:hypothetical protein